MFLSEGKTITSLHSHHSHHIHNTHWWITNYSLYQYQNCRLRHLSHKYSLKCSLNRWVFKEVLNVSHVRHSFKRRGSLFHRWGAAYANARSPARFCLAYHCWRSFFSAERTFTAWVYGMTISCRYLGAIRFMHLNTRRHILYVILASTGNQCSSISTGVMWSCFFFCEIRRAAQCCIIWSWSNR